MESQRQGSHSSLTNAEYDALVYTLPEKPSLLDFVLLYPRAVGHFFRRVTIAFGWRYCAFVVLVYGLNQGVGESFSFFATQYLLTDPRPSGLDLSPERFAAVEGFANVPWQMKAIYGMLSDLIPIYGLHRSPYIAIASVVGTGSFFLLSFASGPAFVTPFVAVLLLLANFSMASPDVMIDASMAERTAANPRHGTDLQALAWGMMSCFSLVASIAKGYILDSLGTRAVFGLSIVTSLLLFPPAIWQWLGETQSQDAHQCCDIKAIARRVKDTCQATDVAAVIKLSLGVCLLSFALGGISIGTSSSLVITVTAATVCMLVVYLTYTLERSVSYTLAKASVYIFLSGAIQPSTPVMFYWYKETDESCTPAGIDEWYTPLEELQGGFWEAVTGDVHNAYPRPCFDAKFVGWMSVVGYASFALGTGLYNRYFSSWPYRKIWTGTQIIFVFLNLLDYVWISRWNLKVGIPDKAFVMGEEVLSPLFARLSIMPMFVLTARLCPPQIAATLFALTMGLSNFGAKMGGYAGIALLSALGGVDSPGFHNLRVLVIIRSLTRALPILLIPFLVPDGSPSDPEHLDAGCHSSDGDTGEEAAVDRATKGLDNRITTHVSISKHAHSAAVEELDHDAKRGTTSERRGDCLAIPETMPVAPPPELVASCGVAAPAGTTKQRQHQQNAAAVVLRA